MIFTSLNVLLTINFLTAPRQLISLQVIDGTKYGEVFAAVQRWFINIKLYNKNDSEFQKG